MNLRRSVSSVVLSILALALQGSSAHGQDLVQPPGPAIAIGVSNGVLITLDRSADTVFVTDPTIADVQVKSPRLIYLFGKDPGQTSLYAVDSEQKPILRSAPEGADYTNSPPSNFGCATTTNLGLMVANPADLVRGSPAGGADATFAAGGVERYRTGAVAKPATQGAGGAPSSAGDAPRPAARPTLQAAVDRERRSF